MLRERGSANFVSKELLTVPVGKLVKQPKAFPQFGDEGVLGLQLLQQVGELHTLLEVGGAA